MTYQSIILSHITEYCQKKKWIYKSNRGDVSIFCPFCRNDAMTVRVIAKTHKMKCLNPDCQKKFSLLSIVRANEEDKSDKEKVSKESILQYLKDLLNINVITAIDDKEIDKLLDRYEKNEWSLVPIAKDSKVPVEKGWTSNEHRDKNEWKSWIESGLNIGVRTGQVSNLTILDLDIKEIPEELKLLLGETLTQESSKGFHFCYQYEKDIPKGRIDKFTLDLENTGGQVLISPSSVNGVPRKWINNNPIAKMSEELKELILKNIKPPKTSLSEKIENSILNEDFKVNLSDLKNIPLKNNNLEGCCNSSILKLLGMFRKKLSSKDVGYVAYILNNHLLENPMNNKDVRAMLNQIEKYDLYDNEELASEILKYLKYIKTADRLEITRAMKEESKKTAQVLDYLVKEEKIIQAGKHYTSMDKLEWITDLINTSRPINFKMPYFYDIMNFNYGDILVIGAKTGSGKGHISMNIIKQLVSQNIVPYYIPRETGGRHDKIALRLGLKEGDFFKPKKFCTDPTAIEFEKNSVTIIDWLLPKDYAVTDKIFDKLSEQVHKSNAILIVFTQIRKDGRWFAPDQTESFPAFTTKYFYDDESDGTFGKFEIHKVRDRIGQLKKRDIPCKFNWATKELIRVDNLKDNTIKPKVQKIQDDKGTACDCSNCKSNENGICKASSMEECPKNNEQSTESKCNQCTLKKGKK